MRVGASNRLVWSLPFERGIEALAKIGYECIEIWAEPPHLIPSNISKDSRQHLRSLFHRLNVEPTLHASSWDLNIASINPTIRKVSTDLVKDSINLAVDIEANLVVIHPGRMSSSKGVHEETYATLVGALGELAQIADTRGIILALENMEKKTREVIITPNDLKSLIEDVQSNRLVGLVDVAHANTVLDPARFLAECVDVLGHVHVSDNDGSVPTHLPLGKGTIDFRKVFDILLREGYNGRVIVEGFFSEDPLGTAKADFEFAATLIRRSG